MIVKVFTQFERLCFLSARVFPFIAKPDAGNLPPQISGIQLGDKRGGQTMNRGTGHLHACNLKPRFELSRHGDASLKTHS